MSAVSDLERCIARILLLRYELDIARLFSTRLYSIALLHLPTLTLRCVALTGPSWPAFNADSDDIKDFFRAAITMDLRQAGERVATKSVLWSYTALRHFALSNNVPVCPKSGLNSLRLLPYYPALRAHLTLLESMPPPSFAKPPHLGPPTEGTLALDAAYADADDAFRAKVRLGYERLVQTLWRTAREFDVRGYGLILREKLTTKWCDCGCSTDHLGEVCERTVREEEEESGVRSGKQKEWDGRGSGVYGWETEDEEDIWELDLDFGGGETEDGGATIGEMMEWRFWRAEREKQSGNVAFRKGDYTSAVQHYLKAHEIEPELPHYQLNLAAAHLKLSNWMSAEEACSKALGQHRSEKGYYRRAKARKMLGKDQEAVKDLRAVLKIQPNNSEALSFLHSLLPPSPLPDGTPSSTSSSSQPQAQAWRPKPKPARPTPFERSDEDGRRIRVLPLPMKEKDKEGYVGWEKYVVKKVD